MLATRPAVRDVIDRSRHKTQHDGVGDEGRQEADPRQ
jgi:hypothetical protein